MAWSEKTRNDRGTKISLTLILILIGALSIWWAVNQSSSLSGTDKMIFYDRFVLVLTVYSIFVGYYAWKNLKPENWQLGVY